jgi:hypothetical protein
MQDVLTRVGTSASISPDEMKNYALQYKKDDYEFFVIDFKHW